MTRRLKSAIGSLDRDRGHCRAACRDGDPLRQALSFRSGINMLYHALFQRGLGPEADRLQRK